MLFLICFFRHFITPISVDYQYVTSNQQDFKKKIKIIVGTYTFGGVLIDLEYAAKITQNGVYSAKSIRNLHI